MIALPLLASAMLTFFTHEVQADAAALGIPAPMIRVVTVPPKTWEWAWVENCEPELPCRPLINIRQDVLDLLGYDTMREVALHETLHLAHGDHYGWSRLSLRDQQRRHQRIKVEIRRRLPMYVLRTAAVEAQWWKENHPGCGGP